ncbi:SRR1-like protein isoform X2 [Nerophis lumbriciformis]|uniref:SRR1-like protein isoform X2 n=1 Tax=Nerophis lumbriciformis TaxID=546530 RepID=UPI002ADF5773|nr:SRR1-like protein isoform X2 [Nerophis lumbriciformis]
MSDTRGEWQVARRRKGASKSLKSLRVSPTCCQTPLDVGKTIKRIKETVAELKCEEVWKEWKDQILPSLNHKNIKDSAEIFHESLDDKISPFQCVCYGLGTFSSCVSARYQLAMMLLLLDAGKEGKRLATKPTLFYLMHCGKALYNNLLWKNWSAQCLPLLMIIGNSFSSMRERMLEKEFQRDYRYISLAVTVCEDRPLTCPSRLLDVFGDTALVTFKSSALIGLPQSTWTETPEPLYQHCPDLEIIQNEPIKTTDS